MRMCLSILLLFALLAAFPPALHADDACGDVKLVLAVAKGEPDAARRDAILRYGARYAKGAADRAALLSAMSKEAAKALEQNPVKCPSCKGTGQGLLGKPCPQCHGAGWTGPFRTAVSGNPFACDMCRGTGEMYPGKTCPKCHGSGMSGPMKGKSAKAAKAAKSDKVSPGWCDLCRGTGEMYPGKTCPACHGAGWPKMKAKAAGNDETNGAKVMAPRCDLCNGTGELYPGHTCPACHGAGWPMMKSVAKGDAAKALDPNPVKCPSCQGSGHGLLGKPCHQCHGAGYTGPMKSAAIWQDNPFQCGMCAGTGQIPPGKLCPVCHGAGIPGPMRARTPALHDRSLERLVKARLAAAPNAYDQRLLSDILRLREESRPRN